MRNETKRNGIIIGALLVTIALMTIGYAALATQLTINGTASTGDASWDISFLSITKNTTLSTTDAVEVDEPTASGTAATFTETTGVTELNAAAPTQITYKVDRLDSENGSPVQGTGDLLNTTGKNYFRVTIEWPASSTEVPTETTTKTGTIYLNYEQKVS